MTTFVMKNEECDSRFLGVSGLFWEKWGNEVETGD